MKKKNITIKDVAKKAGVGVGTVSRVINNSPHVNPRTKEHVLKIIQEMGYMPNPHARRLSSGHTKIITTIFPQMVGEFHQLLLSGIDEVFEKEGYTSFVYPLYSENRYKFVRESSDFVLGTDGVIIDALNVDKLLKQYIPKNVPVVSVEFDSQKYDSVILDNFYGGMIAGDYLSNFEGDLFIVTHDRKTKLESTVFEERVSGFIESIERKGRKVAKIFKIDLDWLEAIKVAKAVFSISKKPLIFATTDYFAFPVIEFARIKGLEPKEDFFLCGFDNLTLSSILNITTIKQPIKKMGKTAGEMLLRKIKGYSRKRQTVAFKPELIERNT
ncbi:LacI family transcriptional regulator [Thermosipho affectus]|uniref:LacI family transcriptional regulator n=1 Tax=Thermosipho affectus TaxID=660294 RepID=A0ABX3IGU7_9BACT|nr:MULTISPECIES: LacI family DNA-binding transcriptional regulator [Thermosipho]ANQ53710.1 LacI family transcriptional regulator [Thermosipho sp. 1070]APT72156.1 LacI family transcriptional regulator [Thermosipho sp. 1063]ONN27059.1 LacI family transcriptional regulator [Thermosipho affectus]OOC43398.1 LacI family transcriptional regulator [Thermosipho sp. 1074]